MKQINTYINEKLHITTKSHLYSCHPKTKEELREIIVQRIKSDGNECELNDIDVSNIEDMSQLFNAMPNSSFSNAIFKDFNGDISRWDVSNVKDMTCMFRFCENFNCDISGWDVSNLIKAELMFCKCTKFNQNISKWDVSNIKNIHSMFFMCSNFKQNLNKWDISNVEIMGNTFKDCPTKPKWYRGIHKL